MIGEGFAGGRGRGKGRGGGNEGGEPRDFRRRANQSVLLGYKSAARGIIVAAERSVHRHRSMLTGFPRTAFRSLENRAAPRSPVITGNLQNYRNGGMRM